MLENECKNVETKKGESVKISVENSVYACINKNANEIMNQCLPSIYVSTLFYFIYVLNY